MTSIVWFRRDLRLSDNPALHLACEQKQPLVAIYIHCESWVAKHDLAPIQLDFIREHLHILRRDLLSKNIPLHVYKVETAAEISPLVLSLMQKWSANRLYFNAEYPIDELNRDHAVNLLLQSHGFSVKRCHDRVLAAPGQILNGQGEAYKVFTPFRNKLVETLAPLAVRGDALVPLPTPRKLGSAAAPTCDEQEIDNLFSAVELVQSNKLWKAGEAVAQKKLSEFIFHQISQYKQWRDFPAVDATSSLSPYFVVGSLSLRQAMSSVLQFTQGEWSGANEGANCWINELIWREFYQHIVSLFPQVCKNHPMQAYTDAFPWKQDGQLLNAWCEGKTGIPIVDAAMRQLLATGWMHNRLRMVVAMFLTKNCQIDWRWGEDYFMSQLIDGDFAANNGGWQWSASTGTDAAPYFRIFNPISQSERFDPNGEFIRKWIPELAHLSNKHIHNPPASNHYPRPIVDLSASRKETIALFAQLPSIAH
jgi:deoxyribodipyrimidine photo-lyase